MFDTDREFYAWLSGWIEGEGCLTIRKEQKNGVPPRYRSILQISQMKPQPLIYIQEKLGGKIYQTKSTGLHHWRIIGNQTIPLLQKIIPFMFIKKEQAELLIELHQVLKSYPAKRKGRPEYVSMRLDEIKNRIHVLNARVKRRNMELS